jgi:hypothetical protein
MKSMRVELKIPVILGGVFYNKGPQEVPKKHLIDSWFFDALVKEEKAIVIQNIEKIKDKTAVKPVKEIPVVGQTDILEEENV